MHKEPCISKIKYEDFCRETQIFLPSRLDVAYSSRILPSEFVKPVSLIYKTSCVGTRATPPLYAARCIPAPAHTRLTPAAPSAPCSMNIHDQQAAARSGRWRKLWCRPYKLCSDFNSQQKRPGDLFLGLSVLDLGPMYAVRRKTSDIIIA